MLPIILSFILGFVPMLVFAAMVYWIDRYEKEPILLLGGVFTWGALIAAGGAFLINTVLGIGVYLFTGSETTTDLTTGSLIAPIIEEILKGTAVCLVYLVLRNEFDSILDGIIYGAIVGLGFAATENAYYIYTYGYQESGYSGILALVFIRVILVGWQHPFFTAFTGIGLAASRMSKGISAKLLYPCIGLGLAVTAHALHNFLSSILSEGSGFLLGSLVDWAGWLAMLLFTLWALWREKKNLAKYLQEEVSLKIITQPQYQAACSTAVQSWRRFLGLFNGNFIATNRFFQVCGELAHKKRQLATLGEEGDYRAQISRLRDELYRLSPLIN